MPKIGIHPRETPVLECLAGASLTQVARNHHLPVQTLRQFLDQYTAAGRAALQYPSSSWRQFNVEFALPGDTIPAQHLLPTLLQGQADNLLTWWFMRKKPGWRLRVRATEAGAESAEPTGVVDAALRTAHAAGFVQRWWCTPYEPETAAFGGPHGMPLAHDLFTADSTGVARLIVDNPSADQRTNRQLLSLLLMTHLQRAAGLDLYERADVWALVAAQRPAPEIPPGTRNELTQHVRVALTTQTEALTEKDGYLAAVAGWAAEIADIGTQLGDAASRGLLTRGLRSVLAQHTLFHWNRLGLTINQQAAWASIAQDALLGPRPNATGPR